ncbi:uncharacterized protein LOC132745056 [Ruditapes philippinarum]|uniref:uncharacterized protein LOC132745056 n=1 Tax=Ruditapes philippinarum TaxID=129788 RepID=UPI00295BB488|nr:uncharacterized protein LOC132745056 [Ruditapes philippinarum]
METYMCIYCDLECKQFCELIDHVIIRHPDENLKIRIIIKEGQSVKSYSKNFNIIPNELKSKKKFIIPVEKTKSVEVSRIPESSPFGKCARTSTPIKSIHDCPNLNMVETTADDLSAYFDDMQLDVFEKTVSVQTDPTITLDLSSIEKPDHDAIKDIIQKIPAVIDYLHSEGQLEMYTKFTSLLADRKLPLTNIAFLLFSDVVNWFTLESSKKMRYSNDVKLFWNIGLKLFKGKFLRFMSGWKNQGQSNHNPSESSINFAVPSRGYLENSFMSDKFKNMQPGILHDMINLISESDPNKSKTFKLCVDGKKINAGLTKQKYGDVNLWGLEGPPSLEEREGKLESDVKKIDDFTTIIEKLDQKGIDSIAEAPEFNRNEVAEKGKNILIIMNERVKELRSAKQNKVVTLEKLNKACINEKLKTKYSYALSAIKTYIYRVNIAINKVMQLINYFGEIIAVSQEVGNVYMQDSYCDLSTQGNYICLTGPETVDMSSHNIESSTVKQRTEPWHTIRKAARVTGSTCHCAIGLSGLKGQKQHFEQVINRTEKPQPTKEAIERMQYGTDNEINAVATLTSKFLPVYLPGTNFVEEGCEIVRHNGNIIIVVSPDGSIRGKEDVDIQYAVEIKCPYPGKVYTTPVYYKMPWYYVSQVLMEMYVLKVNRLLFVCYSSDSSTIFEAPFDEILWTEINDRIKTLYGDDNPSIMTRLPPGNKTLIEKMKTYCSEKVKFIAEIPSVKVTKCCQHAEQSNNEFDIGRNKHKTTDNQNINNPSPSGIMTYLHEAKEMLREANDLQRHLASEVLVFLISDLDRIHERERQYEIPVAYALKGYSLTSATLREMIDKVLYDCFRMGVYVPALSYDGLWSKIAVRSKTEFPLTLLQLQKDIMKEARSTDQKEILNIILPSNCVKAETFVDVVEKTVCEIKLDRNGNFISIDLYRARNCHTIFRTSATTNKYMKKEQKLKTKAKTNQNEDNSVDISSTVSSVLDAFVPDVAENIQDDLLQNIEATVIDSSRTETSTQELDLSTFFDELQSPQENDQNVNANLQDINTQQELENNQEVDEMNECLMQDVQEDAAEFLLDSDREEMLKALKQEKSRKWNDVTSEQFKSMLKSERMIESSFTKNELLVCLATVSTKLKESNIHFAVSWLKKKLVGFTYNLNVGNFEHFSSQNMKKKKSSPKVDKLSKLCTKIVRKMSKQTLSSIYAEHIYADRLLEWQNHSPFARETHIDGIEYSVSWYSMPEYVPNTLTYLFDFLDSHHLFVNARVKCCGSGMQECGISRKAWVSVAENMRTNKSGLNIALVDDLVDKQSNAFAKKTFSEEVENAMRESDYSQEANFCKLIREWYSAEDDPGIEVTERIKRRLRFREWLLYGVRLDEFPPYGRFVKGIPHVMFEGLLTNIERKIQITPFVKSGAFCPRSLGSLEAENFFGEFQDLDPKGSGVIRPDDIPKALQTACELISTRRNPERKFYMHTSRAKVYDVHELMDSVEDGFDQTCYMTPEYVSRICPRNHIFDHPFRAKRKHAKRKSGEISQPALSGRGVQPVREYHRLNENMITAEKRYGGLSDIS